MTHEHVAAGSSAFLAIDLGATSGRIMAGTIRDGELEMTEGTRFPNEPRRSPAGWEWDTDALLASLSRGVRATLRWCRESGLEPRSLAVDTWGVDFGVIDAAGHRIVEPAHHRSASAEARARVEAMVGAQVLFERTGVQPQTINTVFQLADLCQHRTLPADATVLLMPDLFTWYLTGHRRAEHTIASTTQMLDPWTGAWDDRIPEGAGIDRALLPPLVSPGTLSGPLTPEMATALDAPSDLVVVHPPSHDTAAAAAAIPLAANAVFVSCGTWSLIGVEADEPLTTQASFAAGFTNELGLGGRSLVLRNLTGLWLLEDAVRAWRTESPDLDLEELVAQARALGPTDSIIDVDDERFLRPGDMVGCIVDRCRASGQAVPESRAEVTRCILQSLAVAYRISIRLLEETTGRRIDVMHLVGGGARNDLLCQLAADACGRIVLAGPVEATSTGNLLSQALAVGELASLEELRDVAGRSAAPTRFEPRSGPGFRTYWERAEALVHDLSEGSQHA
ncbi:MAG: rhamnulokinase family protein [Nitriliruptoraceae bacterium]